MDRGHRFRPKRYRDVPEPRHQPFVSVPDTVDPCRAVVIVQFVNDPSDDIVLSWTQPPAGNNGRGGLGRIEKDLFPRAGDLETQRDFTTGERFLRSGQHVIVKNAMSVVFESLRMPMT